MGKNKFVAIDEVASDHKIASVHVAGVPDFHLADIMRGVADAAAARGVDLRAGEIADLAIAMGNETFGPPNARTSPGISLDPSGRSEYSSFDARAARRGWVMGDGGPANPWSGESAGAEIVDPWEGDSLAGLFKGPDPLTPEGRDAIFRDAARARYEAAIKEKHRQEESRALPPSLYGPPALDPGDKKPGKEVDKPHKTVAEPGDPDAGPDDPISARLISLPSFLRHNAPGRRRSFGPGANYGPDSRAADGRSPVRFGDIVGGLADQPVRGRVSLERVLNLLSRVPGGGGDPWRP